MPEPLIRPNIPAPSSWDGYLWGSRTSGQHSNFGPAWETAARALSKASDRIALPCSNGTDAVVLALIAAQRKYVEYEAFTFQATELAAKRYATNALAIRTNAPIDHVEAEETSVIRTIPFGSARSLHPEPKAQLIIDAAGAFGPGAFRHYPDDAIITCSFHATKNFPIGEGGCVFLPKGWERQARLVKAAMNFGLDDKREYLRFITAAGNYKLDELHSALLIYQLERSEYFRERSLRIAHETRLLANAKDCWLPYSPGEWQSLSVIAHKEPDTLVAKLGAAGFVARRVYHPFIKTDLLTYDEARLVAVPSDCKDNVTFWQMHEVINA